MHTVFIASRRYDSREVTGTPMWPCMVHHYNWLRGKQAWQQLFSLALCQHLCNRTITSIICYHCHQECHKYLYELRHYYPCQSMVWSFYDRNLQRWQIHWQKIVSRSQKNKIECASIWRWSTVYLKGKKYKTHLFFFCDKGGLCSSHCPDNSRDCAPRYQNIYLRICLIVQHV